MKKIFIGLLFILVLLMIGLTLTRTYRGKVVLRKFSAYPEVVKSLKQESKIVEFLRINPEFLNYLSGDHELIESLIREKDFRTRFMDIYISFAARNKIDASIVFEKFDAYPEMVEGLKQDPKGVEFLSAHPEFLDYLASNRKLVESIVRSNNPPEKALELFMKFSRKRFY